MSPAANDNHPTVVAVLQESSTVQVAIGRSVLRGLGEELVKINVDVRRNRDADPNLFLQWSQPFSRLVPMDAGGLEGTITRFDDPYVFVGYGEQLLDVVIRMSTESEWVEWLKASLAVSAVAGNACVLHRLLEVGGREIACFRNSLDLAAVGGSTDVLSALVAAGKRPIAGGVSNPLSSLQIAARSGHREFVRGLMAAGAPLEYAPTTGTTALAVAVKAGHRGVVRELLALGANLNPFNGNSTVDTRWYRESLPLFYTPLSLAVAENDELMVQLLLDAGAQSSHEHAGAHCPLHVAAYLGHSERVEQLLRAGKDIECPDTRGFSALHVAASFNQSGAVDVLLRHRADTTVLTHDGLSPIDVVATGLLGQERNDHMVLPEVARSQRLLFTYNAQTADSIRQLIQGAKAWARRGWLVMMRARHIARNANHAGKGIVETLPREAEFIGEEGRGDTDVHVRQAKVTQQWHGVVTCLLRCPDDGGLFRKIVLFL